MIKIQGMLRRNRAMTHEECVDYHKTVHSQMGVDSFEVMGHYVLYYMKKEYGIDGAAHDDFQFDGMGVEWFYDDLHFEHYQEYLNEDPERGMKIKEDEERFCDRYNCLQMPYKRRVAFFRESDAEKYVIVRVLKYAEGVERGSEKLENGINAIRDVLGDSLCKLTVQPSEYMCRLSEGRVDEMLIDVVEVITAERSAFSSERDFVEAFVSGAVAEAEVGLFDPACSYVYSAEEKMWHSAVFDTDAGDAI